MEPAAPARTFTPRTLVLTGMIAFAVGVRLLIHFVPGVLPWHFTPVEAIALFGGAYFSDRRTALIVPMAAMLVADLVIGTYALMPVIYACIAASTLLGFSLRGRATALRIAGCGVAGSVLFFVVTNFAEWAVGGTEFCRAGLLPCYVAALPFFDTWLAGTLAWSAVLFGGFALLSRGFPALAPQPARA